MRSVYFPAFFVNWSSTFSCNKLCPFLLLPLRTRAATTDTSDHTGHGGDPETEETQTEETPTERRRLIWPLLCSVLELKKLKLERAVSTKQKTDALFQNMSLCFYQFPWEKTTTFFCCEIRYICIMALSFWRRWLNFLSRRDVESVKLLICISSFSSHPIEFSLNVMYWSQF